MKEQIKNAKNELQERIITYLTAAFGLVVGLAWNEAIKALIEFLFPIQKDTLSAKFLYAFVLTIVFVFITMYLVRLFKKKE